MKTDFAIRPAGDAALVVDFEPRLDPEINACAVALARAARDARRPGVADVVIGYHSVTVYFDPLAEEAADVSAWLRGLAARPADRAAESARSVAVAVMYGGEWGPDLGAVAAFARCDEAEVVRLHAAREYRVYMLGFVPGFAYMAAVDRRIAAPRRTTPRVAVPAGSVGIAGPQTGIYPMQTPGGWNLIGRTPLVPFDPGRPEPCAFRPGDRIRFHPLDRWPD
jgi:inhibitor of KinA